MNLSALHTAVRAALDNQAPEGAVVAKMSAVERASLRLWQRRQRNAGGRTNLSEEPSPTGDWVVSSEMHPAER